MRTTIVKKDSYYDSVFLMQITAKLKGRPGVGEVQVTLGTPQNRELLRDLGFAEGLDDAGPNDLVIAVEADSKDRVDALRSEIEAMLKAPSAGGEVGGGSAHRPGSTAAAVAQAPGSNLAIISVPGEYAAYEARKALDLGLHVMLFSDNVSVEDEVALKRLGVERGLLVMGPDCGTAIINGSPLCFANEVRRGSIGMVAASGTGAQEVSSLIDRFGGGCSQVVGTGGRDLKASVGGLTTLQAIDALAQDPATKVIVVVSKPPAPEVAGKVLAALAECGKPSVVHFIGAAPASPGASVQVAGTLEEAALAALALAAGEPPAVAALGLTDSEIASVVAEATQGLAPSQKFLRGYFTGGTLCDEALFVLEGAGFPASSNIHHDPARQLADPFRSQGTTLIDLGDDVFTRGRPHPMIEPSTRVERMEAEAGDPDVAVIMLDVVLGHGSHGDPAGALVPALRKIRSAAEARGGKVTVLASVVGTDRDPQGCSGQREILEAEGVVVAPSNARMAGLAVEILRKLGA